MNARLGGAELGRGGQGVIETMNRLPDFVHGAEVVQLVYVDLRTGRERRKDVSTRLMASMVPGAVFKLPLEEDRRRTRSLRPATHVPLGGAARQRANALAETDSNNANSANSANANSANNGDSGRNTVLVERDSSVYVDNANAKSRNAKSKTGNAKTGNAKSKTKTGNARLDRSSGPPSLEFGEFGREVPSPLPPALPLPLPQKQRRLDPIREEFEGNLMLANAIAMGNVGRRKHVRVLSSNTPFLVREDRFMVIGIICGIGEDAECFPIYRRMGGSLEDFSKRFPQDATLGIALDAIRACLDVMELLISVGAHHCDIKEDNMLYDIVCAPRPQQRRTAYPPPCNVDFAVSDFGLAMIHPTRVSNRGTPGSICPLTYPNDDKGRAQYVNVDHILSAVSAEDVWASYERERSAATSRATSPSAVHEKADLFAVGVMLLRFAKLDEPPPPPLGRPGTRTGTSTGTGTRRTLPRDPGADDAVRAFAMKLIRGDRGSIWTIERAQKTMSKLRSSTLMSTPRPRRRTRTIPG